MPVEFEYLWPKQIDSLFEVLGLCRLCPRNYRDACYAPCHLFEGVLVEPRGEPGFADQTYARLW